VNSFQKPMSEPKSPVPQQPLPHAGESLSDFGFLIFDFGLPSHPCASVKSVVKNLFIPRGTRNKMPGVSDTGYRKWE
jgi:hypothetical protein